MMRETSTNRKILRRNPFGVPKMAVLPGWFFAIALPPRLAWRQLQAEYLISSYMWRFVLSFIAEVLDYRVL